MASNPSSDYSLRRASKSPADGYRRCDARPRSVRHMAVLEARGKEPQHQWRRELPEEPITLGRDATRSNWDVPWDRWISRLSATLAWQEGKLLVRKAPNAVNSIVFRGKPLEE